MISKYIIVIGEKVVANAETFGDAQRKAWKYRDLTHRTAFVFCGLEKYEPQLTGKASVTPDTPVPDLKDASIAAQLEEVKM